MDYSPPNFLPRQHNQMKIPPSKSFSTKVIFLEIGFVFILLCLILGILNFLNIIQVPSNIPLIPLLPQKVTPTPTLIASSKVAILLKNFAQANFPKNSLPSRGINALEVTKATRGLQLAWTGLPGHTPYQVVATYNDDKTDIQEIKAYAYTYQPSTIISSSSAQEITQKYFITQNVSANWKCGIVKDNEIICNQFYTVSGVRRGFSILSLSKIKSAILIISCEILPNSNYFYTADSCIINGI